MLPQTSELNGHAHHLAVGRDMERVRPAAGAGRDEALSSIQARLAVQRAEFGPGNPRHHRLKQAFDIVLCLLLVPALIPLMLGIAVAILLDSGRPIFFTQLRVGRGGRPFTMYKFRTLTKDYNDPAGRAYMVSFVRGEIGSNDGRANKPLAHGHMTRLGQFLRRTSLDELPQVLNVLFGHMSLVGPRPNVVWEVAAYPDRHLRRLDAKPGITGLAQVRGRSSITFDEIARSDIEYVDRGSLKLDIQILWKTVTMVIGGDGAG